MAMIFILGFVIFLTCAVVGILYYLMKKESQRIAEEKVAPITDFSAFKKSIATPAGALTLDDELSAAKKRLADLEKGNAEPAVSKSPKPLDNQEEGLKLSDSTPPVDKNKDLPAAASVVNQKPEEKHDAMPSALEPKVDEEFYKNRISQLEEELRIANDRSVSQAQEALGLGLGLYREQAHFR